MEPSRVSSLLVVSILAGCAGADTSLDDEVAASGEYRVLVGHFAEEGVSQSLVIREAFIGEDEFYVSYDSADGLVYAGGSWSNRIDILAVQESGDDTYSGPYILPLEYQKKERWATIPESPIRPRVLNVEQWDRFRSAFFDSIIPEDPRAGVVMHFDADDYFLFHNEIGKFEARHIIHKPADYHVAGRVDFAEIIRRGLPQLGAFLLTEGITERRIVFNTGDAGAYSLPFLFVDLDLPVAVFVRYALAPRLGTAAGKET